MTDQAISAALEPVKSELLVLCQLPYSSDIAADRKILFRHFYDSLFVYRDIPMAAAALREFPEDLSATPEACILYAILLIMSPTTYGEETISEMEDVLDYLSECDLERETINMYGALIYSSGLWSAGHAYSHILDRVMRIRAAVAASALRSVKVAAGAVMGDHAPNRARKIRPVREFAADAVAAFTGSHALASLSGVAFSHQEPAELARQAHVICSAYPQLRLAYMRRIGECSAYIQDEYRWLAEDGFKAYLHGLRATITILVQQKRSLVKINILDWIVAIRDPRFLQLPCRVLDNMKQIGLEDTEDYHLLSKFTRDILEIKNSKNTYQWLLESFKDGIHGWVGAIAFLGWFLEEKSGDYLSDYHVIVLMCCVMFGAIKKAFHITFVHSLRQVRAAASVFSDKMSGREKYLFPTSALHASL